MYSYREIKELSGVTPCDVRPTRSTWPNMSHKFDFQDKRGSLSAQKSTRDLEPLPKNGLDGPEENKREYSQKTKTLTFEEIEYRKESMNESLTSSVQNNEMNIKALTDSALGTGSSSVLLHQMGSMRSTDTHLTAEVLEQCF